MDPDRWARVKEIFHAALARDPGQRESFLRDACAGDLPLRETVESMLAREPDAATFLESSALGAEAMALAWELENAGGAGISAAESSVAGARASAARARPEPVQGNVPPLQRLVRSSRPPWWIYLLAAVFLADVLIRTWCYALGPEEFGFTWRLEGGRHVVAAVTAGGLAERAGMKPGEVLVARDGRPFGRVSDPWVTRPNLEVGRSYRFEVERDGRLLEFSIPMRRVRVLNGWDWYTRLVWQAATFVMFATALLIAFKRPRDPVAQMGALTLAVLSVSFYLFNLPPGYAVAWRSLPLGLGALLMIPNLGIPLVGPIGVTFFALFPRPLFRSRWPWVLIWLPALWLVPVYVRDTFLIVYHPAEAFGRTSAEWVRPIQTAAYALYGLGMLAAITVNYLRLTDVTERRRLRVMLAGGAAGTLPGLVRLVIVGVAPKSALRDYLMTGWPDVLIALVFLVFPVSFAYAILRHRLLGIRVIVRLGVQYAFAKGLVISLVPVLGVILVVDALVHGDQPLIEIVRARGWVYAILAGLAVLAHTLRHKMGRAIDRRFFREQYDATHLLREVAEQARRAGSLERAAPAVVARMEAALHPEFASLLFRRSGEADFRCVASAPSGLAPPAIREGSRVVALLRAMDRPLEVTGGGCGLARTAPARRGDGRSASSTRAPAGADRHGTGAARGPAGVRGETIPGALHAGRPRFAGGHRVEPGAAARRADADAGSAQQRLRGMPAVRVVLRLGRVAVRARTGTVGSRRHAADARGPVPPGAAPGTRRHG